MRVSANRNSTTNETTFRQVWRHKQVRKALIVGSALQLFQQLSGINTVMYYSTSIVQMAGFADTSQSIWLASTTAAVNFGCTFIGMHYVDKSGELLAKRYQAGIFTTYVSSMLILIRSPSTPVRLSRRRHSKSGLLIGFIRSHVGKRPDFRQLRHHLAAFCL